MNNLNFEFSSFIIDCLFSYQEKSLLCHRHLFLFSWVTVVFVISNLYPSSGTLWKSPNTWLDDENGTRLGKHYDGKEIVVEGMQVRGVDTIRKKCNLPKAGRTISKNSKWSYSSLSFIFIKEFLRNQISARQIIKKLEGWHDLSYKI